MFCPNLLLPNIPGLFQGTISGLPWDATLSSNPQEMSAEAFSTMRRYILGIGGCSSLLESLSPATEIVLGRGSSHKSQGRLEQERRRSAG